MGTRASVINLRCDVCGTEIVVSASGDYKWHPIYCCGLEIQTDNLTASGTSPASKRAAHKKLKSAEPTRKKTASRQTAGKKKLKPAKSAGKKSVSASRSKTNKAPSTKRAASSVKSGKSSARKKSTSRKKG